MRAGDRVPADGRVLAGQASLDTAPITGESVPLEAGVGMEVFGGSINLDGLLHIEVTRIGAGIDARQSHRAHATRRALEAADHAFARTLRRQYLVLVLLIAAVTWFTTNNAPAMLAVLVAACPCALALSAPATAIAGIAVAARTGF